ncbi:hypothetical protein EMIHUDRAFT_241315 [Emiliania huxleyi CCMP1516]|uniref:Uncharacterized protein n=2 Tax=Emiliania huxleyi TaxID=2903 RepID=A0A0D3JCW0_EMIH1|nr:hypothetical protein EMIHUDRAFT_241315 [Emiliania huxleyi CCMP1516]EOD21345.1 hypothetical protein EMIHUDRAFT_241315 [Emiliania huxleyi CCMP1516]|eukprot:XP_005773774.1 hypothetical protein EMIHUDRAFT_241315 [Emiliania huxleyi CCMP1516]
MPACAAFSVHVAFYLWYGTPALDGRWLHWDHATLPHWTDHMNERFPPGKPFIPPDEPHSPYYPARGLYSSRDESVLREQMREIAAAGIDSVMLSWWGQAGKDIRRDSQGVSTDELVPAVLDAAAAAGVGVSWHVEPYGGRTPASVLDDLRYLHERFGAHPALWRQPPPAGSRDGSASDGSASDGSASSLPLVFLYDVSAEHTGGGSPAEKRRARAAWREVMRQVRGSPFDATVLSLFLDERDVDFVADAGFDGAYSYFAASGFTEGSSPGGWRTLRQRMAATGKAFAPSVGPGYNDTLIRPWNGGATRPREGGRYYDEMWRAALDASASVVTITSYNEWGEGTQVEAARPHVTAAGAAYADYAPDPGGAYLDRTREWILRGRRERGCTAEERVEL